ncbi:UPF0389 protein CG9231 [Diabrotica virgifera virgifera]|uniref:UPF0389 protein CG9231 n=1 Tax=Diabrotica virgifera virgifera TaxID=50390 RepID=A0A6P7GVS4_DIAVI|nr:UPF0389 protein CG9231 [Diabrotica virgifera virgifera]XP_050508812.1 UPF0389 protein CG9231 [Diabrotica virgifera virgifera]
MNYISNFFAKTQRLKPTTLVRFTHSLESSHKVNNLEKKFLVWTGKYKNVAEVPPYVTQSTMERCRNRMRIKIANYMMAATAVGCLAMVYLGKQDAKKGKTLSQENKDWHAKIKAEHEAKKDNA